MSLFRPRSGGAHALPEERKPAPDRVVPVRGRRLKVGRWFHVHDASHISGELVAGAHGVRGAGAPVGGEIRVPGRLICTGRTEVADGNRWYVGPDAVLTVGGGTTFSPNCRVVALHGVTIGPLCAIGWNARILDDGSHLGSAEDGVPAGEVTLGSHVWLGSNVTVLSDTVIGDDCIVASGTVVQGDFSEPGCVISGDPATVVRRRGTRRA